MNFEYQMKESDEKYFLKERHKKTNLIYFILFALFYLAINIPMMMKRFWLFLVIYLFFIILLALILWICNLIFSTIELKMRQKGRSNYESYHFSVTKRGITQRNEHFKHEVLWKDIKKISIRKNYVFIEPKKEGIVFLFQKATMNQNYEPFIEIIKSNMKIKNSN